MDQVTQQTLSGMLQYTQREVAAVIRQIQRQITSLRKSAKVRKNDRMIKLKEALGVAEATGLVGPPVIRGQNVEQLSAFMSGDLMYMRGTKALKAEIDALGSRTLDDPFIPTLRDLEQQYSFYTGVQVLPKEVAVARQDGAVEMPGAPIKPKKALILVLGVLLGGMLGVFVALVRMMFSKQPATTQVLSTSTGQLMEAT